MTLGFSFLACECVCVVCVCYETQKDWRAAKSVGGGRGVYVHAETYVTVWTMLALFSFRREKEKRETSIFRARESCLVHLEKKKEEKTLREQPTCEKTPFFLFLSLSLFLLLLRSILSYDFGGGGGGTKRMLSSTAGKFSAIAIEVDPASIIYYSFS